MCVSVYHRLFLHSDLSTSLYVKLLSASPQQVLEIITSTERKELECQLSNIGPDEISEKCFVEMALEDLKVGLLLWTCT